MCFVYGCSASSGPLTSLHEFPSIQKEPRRHAAWVQFVKRIRVLTPSGKCMIGSKHFTKDCFTNYIKVEMQFATSLKLSDTAIPSIYQEGTCTTAATDTPHSPVSAPRSAYRKREAYRVMSAAAYYTHIYIYIYIYIHILA